MKKWILGMVIIFLAGLFTGMLLTNLPLKMQIPGTQTPETTLPSQATTETPGEATEIPVEVVISPELLRIIQVNATYQWKVMYYESEAYESIVIHCIFKNISNETLKDFAVPIAITTLVKNETIGKIGTSLSLSLKPGESKTFSLPFERPNDAYVKKTEGFSVKMEFGASD